MNHFTKIEADLTVLKWMVSTNIVLTLVVLGTLLFIPGGR